MLGGGIPSVQTPDETLLETLLGTSEYYADASGSDAGFVVRTIEVLLARPGLTAEESAYLQRPAPHDATWQISVANSILDGSEYRTDFVRGVYETYLTFSACPTNTGSPQGDAGLLATSGKL